MSHYGNYAELLKDGDKYGCNCIDGQCSNCGECCTETLPLTRGELLRLKQYAAKHKLKEHRQAPFWDWHSVDLARSETSRQRSARHTRRGRISAGPSSAARPRKTHTATAI